MRLFKIGLLAICMIVCGKVCFAVENNTKPLVKVELLSQKVVINTEQMTLTKLLNVIRNNTEGNIVLAPEYSGSQDLKKIIALRKGVITLRELLDILCIQLEAKWIATGDKIGDIVINPLRNTIVAESENEIKKADLYTVEYAGKPLRKVLKDLHVKSAAKIIMYGNVGNTKIEIMMSDATIEKILSHIADIYNLRLSYTEDGIYKIGK